MVGYIHAQGMRAGIAIKPSTPVNVLWDILDNQNGLEVPDVSLEVVIPRLESWADK